MFDPIDPLWRLSPSLSLREAAALLAGFCPNQIARCERDTGFSKNFGPYETALAVLMGAIQEGALPANVAHTAEYRHVCYVDGESMGDWMPVSDDISPTGTRIRTKDLRAWLAAEGFADGFFRQREATAQPATDSTLREALAEAERARAELAAQVAHLLGERDKAQQEQDGQQQQSALPAIFAGVVLPSELVPFAAAGRIIAGRSGMPCDATHEALESAIVAAGVPLYAGDETGRIERLDAGDRDAALSEAWLDRWWEPEAPVPSVVFDLHLHKNDLQRLVPELADEIICAVSAGRAEAAAQSDGEVGLCEELAKVERARALLAAELASRKNAHAQTLQELQEAHGELAKLQQGRQAQASSASPDPERRSGVDRRKGWPWGMHETERLRLLAEAAHHFWSTYDPADSATAPTNDEVSAWLQKERNVPARMADTMASILRADGLPTGPRK